MKINSITIDKGRVIAFNELGIMIKYIGEPKAIGAELLQTLVIIHYLFGQSKAYDHSGIFVRNLEVTRF